MVSALIGGFLWNLVVSFVGVAVLLPIVRAVTYGGEARLSGRAGDAEFLPLQQLVPGSRDRRFPAP